MRACAPMTTTASGSASRRAGAATADVGTDSPRLSGAGSSPDLGSHTDRPDSDTLSRQAGISTGVSLDDAPECETAPVTTPGPRAIDLNADLGEGFGVWRLGDDDALLGIVTSANVACGFHAGDPSTMRRVCAAAAESGVAVGAQVSYLDLAGFGRRFIDIEPGELADDVLYQLAALDGIARASGTRVSYVKPHGALYNAAVAHEGQARAVVDALVAYGGVLPVLGLPGSALLWAAESAGLRAV